ncbi:hypothetical protein FE236_09900 [Mariprofundus erugo]|uniref:hypothetical protein n=1 Tax=Mariprofundus erugo TaxID=2528639 RepID=UPI0010FDC911|nr:hypothetical protein [Mariprofundus erugo]TLS75266.1 hypothetical protein FE236_09900 [Mariprofundus erugo]
MPVRPDTFREGAVGVCHGPRCRDYGGSALAGLLQTQGFLCERLPCQSLCSYSPVARMNGIAVLRASMQKLADTSV